MDHQVAPAVFRLFSLPPAPTGLGTPGEPGPFSEVHVMTDPRPWLFIRASLCVGCATPTGIGQAEGQDCERSLLSTAEQRLVDTWKPPDSGTPFEIRGVYGRLTSIGTGPVEALPCSLTRAPGTPSAVYVVFYKRSDGAYFVREASATDDHVWGPITVTETGLTLQPDLPEHVVVGTTRVSPAPPVVEEPVSPAPVSPILPTPGGSATLGVPPTRVKGKITLGDFKCKPVGQCDLVERSFTKQKGSLLACYESVLTSDPDVEGRTSIQFSVSRGRATSCMSSADSTGSDDLVKCAVRRVKLFSYPQDMGSVDVKVTVDFSRE